MPCVDVAHSKHGMTVDAWQNMTSDQRRKASDACFRLVQISSSVSIDGSVIVPTTPGHRKKLHQVKWAHVARSTIIKTKKCHLHFLQH